MCPDMSGLSNVSASLMHLMHMSKSGSGCATDADLVEMCVQSSGTLITTYNFGLYVYVYGFFGPWF